MSADVGQYRIQFHIECVGIRSFNYLPSKMLVQVGCFSSATGGPFTNGRSTWSCLCQMPRVQSKATQSREGWRHLPSYFSSHRDLYVITFWPCLLKLLANAYDNQTATWPTTPNLHPSGTHYPSNSVPILHWINTGVSCICTFRPCMGDCRSVTLWAGVTHIVLLQL